MMTIWLTVRELEHFLVRPIFQTSQGRITVLKMTSALWFLDVGGLVTKLQVGWCGENCSQAQYTSWEGATGDLSLFYGTETALLEGSRVKNDVFSAFFGFFFIYLYIYHQEHFSNNQYITINRYLTRGWPEDFKKKTNKAPIIWI